MKYIKLITSLTFIIFSSCRNENNINADYIKNLEEKNKKLENELQNINEQQNYTYQNNKPPEIAQNHTAKYFTIGSTEDEVVDVMGEPTSVNKFEILNEKILFFNSSTVTFKNGKVKQYSNNDNNLMVKYKSKNENQNIENISTSSKKQLSKTKYIYFSCYIEETSKFQSYYSQIYCVSNYTENKALNIQNCLVEKIKSTTFTESKITLNRNEYNTLSAASAKWNDETGKKIWGDVFCQDEPINE